MTEQEMQTIIGIQDIRNLLQAALDKTKALHDGLGPRSHEILVWNIASALGNLTVWRETYPAGDPEKQAYIAKLWAEHDKNKG